MLYNKKKNGRTGRLTDIYNFDKYTIHFGFDARIEKGNSVIVRSIKELITTLPEGGPFEATVTTDKVGQTRELLFYNGKTETIEAKHGLAFVEYTEDTAEVYRSDNIVSTMVFDLYGKAINSYAYVQGELVSNAYFYDGMQIPTATASDVYDENNETTGDTTISDEVASDSVPGALDKNKLTTSAYYASEVKNYLLNPSFESGILYWSKEQSAATPKCRVVVNTYKPLYGAKSLVMMLTQVAPQALSVSQSVALEAGEYTLSGFIRMDGNLHRYGTGSFGAYLQASFGTSVYNTEKITTETISVNGGFRMVSVTFKLTEAQTVVVKAILENCATFAWFDGFQLKKGSAPSYVSYNMLGDGEFDRVNDGVIEGWTTLNQSTEGNISINTSSSYIESINDGSVLSMSNPLTGGYLAVYKDVYLSKKDSLNYVLSAWAHPMQTNDAHNNAMFGIAVQIKSTEEVYFVPFDSKVTYWQQAILPFKISRSGEVRIHVLFAECIGLALFDNVCLVSSDTVSYRYNEYGILESGKGADGNEYKTTVSENGSLIERTLNAGAGDILLEETVRDARYNVTSISNAVTGVRNSYSYDDYGNVKEAIIKNYTTSSTGLQITSSTDYSQFTDEFQQTITNTDSRGFQVVSTFDGMLSVLKKTTFADSSTKYYSYDTTTELLTAVIVRNGSTQTDTIRYYYDDNYRLVYVFYKNTSFSYEYDEWGNVINVWWRRGSASASKLISNQYYGYNGLIRASTNVFMNYNEVYTYDIYGRNTVIKTKYGNTIEMYYDASGRLMKSNNAGEKTLYQYDDLGRLIVSSTRSSSDEVAYQIGEYKYDTKNRLASKTLYSKEREEESHPESQELLPDSASLTTTYTGNHIFRMWNWGIIRVRYDYSGGRTSRENNQWLDTSTHTGGETVLYTRDSYGNLLYKTYYPYTTGDVGSAIRVVYPQYAAQTFTYSYQYNDDSATIKQLSLGDGYYQSYGYDELQRVNSKDILNSAGTTVVNEDYTFLSGRTDIENSTTMLVSTKTVNGITFTMSYDELGRITEIRDSRYESPVKYYYDIYGSLTREDNPYSNQTIVYGIDNYEIRYGVSYYDYTNEEALGTAVRTVNYTFSNLLVTGDNELGAHITYTGTGYSAYIGSRITWLGNRLSNFGSNAYTYDTNGRRLTKYVSGVTTKFYREGDILIRQKSSNDTDIWFYYDNAGAIEGIKYNGVRYFFLTNPLGDVIGIIDTSGNVVVTYTYDAWGNVLSTSGTLATTLGVDNPIRYRGYYYDVESGFYYLNSRYYDPYYGQFISIDSVESGDLFGYCNNDPVNNIDPSGYSAISNWFESVKKEVGMAIYKVGLQLSYFGKRIETKFKETQVYDFFDELTHVDLNNTAESIVIDANYFSGYKGQLVVKGAFPGSMSLGKLMFFDKNDNAIASLKHENGHYVQYQTLGMAKYLAGIGIPSLVGAIKNVQPYYDQPWEVTADLFGGVNRTHGVGAEAIGLNYYNALQQKSLFVIIIDTFRFYI